MRNLPNSLLSFASCLLVAALTVINPLSLYAQDAEPPASDQTALIPQAFLPFVSFDQNAADQAVVEHAGIGTIIPNQYIVVFKEELVTASSIDETAAALASEYNGELLYTYGAALSGFAIRLPEGVGDTFSGQMTRDARIELIEPDQVVTINEGDASNDTINATQSGATWGIDRVDQRNLPLNSQFVYNTTASNVRAYIIDTGILIGHSEFGGRASYGYSAVGGTAADCNGHGTHVAGTVGGATYGVAKGVRLIAVRVLDCSGSGSTSGVIAGVNWVTNQKKTNSGTPMVANMSLGGGISTSLDNAIQSSINAGVVYAVAAGNSNANACNYSPARLAAAMTVAATTSTDSRSSFSNYGSCVDLFAPGSSIRSAWYTSSSATATLSGTSMASPHVAGVAALYLASHTSASPASVASALNSAATSGVVKSPGTNSPNRLLFTNY